MAPPLSLPPPFRLNLLPTQRTTQIRPIRAASEDPTPGPPKRETNEEFEARMARFRRDRSGRGKKAEMRKAKKAGYSKAGAQSSMYLPAVALKEPESEGVKVEFGFSRYSERVNGRIAMLGIVALLLVELGSGKGVLNYHTPGVIFLQLYFVAAVAALYVKYEKERISIWPNSSPKG